MANLPLFPPTYTVAMDPCPAHRDGFPSQIYRDDQGVYRWVASNNVPPDECNAKYHLDRLPAFDPAKQRAARDADHAAFAEGYRAMRAQVGYSAEELYELRAAFEPGETIVDVLTGRRITL